jgi:hypothetical protein
MGLAAALVWLFWTAIDYQRRWNAAPVVEGEIVSVDPPPPNPFPMKFTVAYRDQVGLDRTTVFERADIYANSVGDNVDVRYLPEAPDQPMGPARLNDAAFLKYVPWGIGIGAVYFVLQIVAGVAGLVMGRVQAKVPVVAVSGVPKG